MAQVAMSLTEAFGLTERFGPPVDPLTRRMFLERDLRNGYLPKSPRPEAAVWRKVWRMTATVHSQDGSKVLKKNDILPPGTANPWHLTLIADSFWSPFPKVEPVWVLVEPLATPIDGTATEATRNVTTEERGAVTPPMKSRRRRHRPQESVQKKRKGRKKYADLEIFVELLGWAIDAWRLYRPSKDPTHQEIATAHNIKEVVAANARLGNPALWPEGMSLTTLKNRLSSKEHNIDLDTFMEERPRPGRG